MRLTLPTRFGRYDVRALLGSGGMGEVYLATDPVLNRPVALKIVRADGAADDRLDRFEQEACAASALNHPNILTIYEFGEHEGTRFIASEYVEGESLRGRLAAETRKSGAKAGLSVVDAVDIATQVATALSAAHRAGIIHRDVKPENIAIRPDGLVKVLDFGLAKQMPRDSINAETVMTTTPGVILGTVSYVSPEQARGLAVDARGDIWSLGCVLYEMLTGHVPFEGSSAIDVLASVVGREPASLLDRRPDCPPQLASAVARMLAKDREARQQTMAEVAAELKAVRRAVDGSAAQTEVPLQAIDPPKPLDAERTNPTPHRAPSAHAGRVRRLMWIAAAAVAVLILVRTWWPVAHTGDPPATSSDASPAVPSGSSVAASRRLDFWLTVQRMRDGHEYEVPFVSSGQEIFESGWKFRLNASSPVGISLYVLNVGPAASGQTTLHMLYPLPSVNGGVAAMSPGAVMTSPWYVFTSHKGIERFWLVSSTAPVPELESVTPLVDPSNEGMVSRPEDVAAIVRLLEQHRVDAAHVTKDRNTRHTVVEGTSPVIAHLVELEHQ